MVGLFAQYQMGPFAGRQDVFRQVHLVDVAPDFPGHIAGILAGQARVMVEIRARLLEGELLQQQEAFDVPAFDI